MSDVGRFARAGAPRLLFVETSLSGTGTTAMQLARELGAEVWFASCGPNYYRTHGAVFPPDSGVVDRLLTCDTRDSAQVLALLKGEHVTAVLSAGENHVLVASKIAAGLGARGLDPRAAEICRDKLRQLTVCAQEGLDVPRHVAVPGDAGQTAIEGALRQVALPCVVKPVDGTGSTGVRLCRDLEEVLQAVRATGAATTNARGQFRSQTSLVMEHVTGVECSVEVRARDGRLDVHAVTGKTLGDLPYFVELEHVVPAPLTPEQDESARAYALAAARAVGFNLGLAHVELRMSERGPLLMEVNGRPPGDGITSLVALATGVDPLRVWLQDYLGEEPTWARVEPMRAAAVRFFSAGDVDGADVRGVIRAVHGLTEARSVDGVVTLVPPQAGVTVAPAQDSHGRLGRVVTVGADAAEAQEAARRAAAALHIDLLPLSGAGP